MHSDEYCKKFGDLFGKPLLEIINLLRDALGNQYDFNGYRYMYEDIYKYYCQTQSISFKQRTAVVNSLVMYLDNDTKPEVKKVNPRINLKKKTVTKNEPMFDDFQADMEEAFASFEADNNFWGH